ncbi:hypothetical protein NNJEOMEG_02564 [Fundidesulfovibrio magnetotacticus]|uniref:Thiamine-binding protein domain-containing protein n=1 Tax=Fundidesulfovibrio magnetotacticus TaxID=2730080 RepID=A0A6V8LYJ3_9BACT|nr:MTH1187 family thiamine-binding protein [Fundidesulfovibrio magnetotacticus]GFK94717.1 hypothetical protein NNJEOMEG_02564 [Fundidesulfovibrio magnetotacticus]
MSVLAELSLFPVGAGASLAPHVARALRVIEASGLPYELGPMGTCIEGEWDEVMAVVGACYQAVQEGQERVYLTLKMDCRPGRSGGLSAKTGAVRALLKESA